MVEMISQSPLQLAKQLAQSNVLPDRAGVRLGERAFLGHVNLRGDADDEAFKVGVRTVTGLGLPLRPNSAASNDEKTLCWLGPNEWLLLMVPELQNDLLPQLRDALSDQFVAVTDISSGQTVITIQGSRARQVLAKGCPLDLHPRVFAVGQCGQTVLAKASVLLRPVSGDSIEIVVRRSFADYLWRWLLDAAAEYGVAIV